MEKPLAQKQEIILLEGSCENFSQLKLSPDMIDRNDATPGKFLEMVVHNVDVYRLWVHLRGFQYLQISRVVLKILTEDLWGSGISSEPFFVQLVQKLHGTDYLVLGLRRCHVLRIGTRYRNKCLEF